jgi:hypothetical protein
MTTPEGEVTEVRSPEALYLYRVSRPATSVTIFGRPAGWKSTSGLLAASPPIV